MNAFVRLKTIDTSLYYGFTVCDSCVDKQSELMSYLHELILMAMFATTITIEGSVCYTNGHSYVIDGWMHSLGC